jgi:hypothetical protein
MKRLAWAVLRWPFGMLLAFRDWRAVAKVFAESKGFENAWCRARGHPNGSWYFNAGGLEPDGRCKDCGEDIG